MNTPDGYTLVDVATSQKDLPEGETAFRRKDDGVLLLDVPGPVYIAIPVTKAQVEADFASFSTKLNGKEVTGHHGAAARLAKHIFEGECVAPLKKRAKKAGEAIFDLEDIQDELLAWRVGCSLAETKKKVSQQAIDDADTPEKVAALVKRLGLVVTD